MAPKVENNKLSQNITPKICSNEQTNATEISVYCQNFNRMKSPAKIKEIRQNLLASAFKVILGTEINWDETVNNKNMFENNFRVFRNDHNLQTSSKTSGGGVLIAIITKFKSEEMKTAKHKDFEHVCAEAHIAGETHIFASVYFRDGRKEYFEFFYEKVIKTIMSSMKPEEKLHIYGDFNQRTADFIPDIDNESLLLPVAGAGTALPYLFDTTSRLGLYQINHVKNEQNVHLDLLFTSCMENFCVHKSLSPLWKNEVFHTAIEYSIFIHKSASPYDWEYEELPEFDETNYEKAKSRLLTENLQSIINMEGNIDEEVVKFNKIMHSVIAKTVPLKKRSRTQYSKLSVCSNHCVCTHKLYKNQKTSTNLENYLDICSQLNLSVKTAQEEYRKVENDVKSCPKHFFNYVNTKLKSTNFPLKMHFDGNVGENPTEICNLFAKFFWEVYSTFSEKDRDRDFFDSSRKSPTMYLSINFPNTKS
ncbi:uncharacterized protein LOC129722871 [Wyeomyia smithii]|uniref:uncharacterized protein LOC129722871 n=1 Tax=Wyeomyia smithii TaxID=174621 RepID=UPI002467E214|nr:uncharacterized protein LOC129722871 [Wyeomyia smithii]